MDAVIYAAKSTEDKRGSIDTQLADCRELAQREGWLVAGEFSDENRSAYHGSRGEGLQRAKARAEELAPCVLVVQHSDRLARGDAVQATHLVEIALWAIKAGVTIRSTQDDRTFQDLATAANQGERNTEDSRRKGEATKDGIERAVKRGQWRGSPPPEGYEIVKQIVDGEVVRKMVKRAEDEDKFELIWRLAEEGKSALKISLELDRRGYATRPSRKDREPKPFTVRRVARVLGCRVYAGQQVLHGAIYAGEWEP